MSNRLANRIDRRPVHFTPAADLPSPQEEMAAFMLGMIAVFASVIGLTYAAIGLWRLLS